MAAWMWPPVAAIVVAGIVVAMGGVGRDVGTGTAMVACETCGGSVRSEWRLCPHCGTRLGKKEVDDASERRTEKGKSDG
jgi:tRNA(Ile2) C34 agmatinyltransferase TiaS